MTPKDKEKEKEKKASPPTPPPPDEIDLENPEYYINRELSTIEFNRRVLLESFDDRHPLLEQVKFAAIYSNNMDEFFMVRVSGIKQQYLLNIRETQADGLTPREQIVRIHDTVSELFVLMMEHWHDHLHPQLTENNINIVNYDGLGKKQKRRLDDYFERDVFPVLTPLGFDPGHPFPHISNLSLNLAVVIRRPDDGDTHFARVKVPGTLPRLVPLKPVDQEDELLVPDAQTFVWVEQVIVANLHRLFPGMEIVAAHPFRVTRNTDMEIQEEEADDLLLTMEENLRRRHFGFVVRLEIDESIPDWIRDMLMANLDVGRHDVYTVDGPLGLNSLFELHGLNRPGLKDPPLHTTMPPPLRTADSIFSTLRRQDVLLHHPFDSFSPVVDFVQAAANDPHVLAIKQTLYRVGPKPPIVHALMRARENGKQVTVLVELKARFDEESNIEWARALENAGVHVVYGLIGLKTHAKLCLVVRREKDGLRRYLHMATGNYNSITARIYTDLGFMTSDEQLGADVSELFNYLTGYSGQDDYRKVLVAPVSLRSSIMTHIEREIEHGKDGHIVIKINHVVDANMVRALYRASRAGVKVELFVRGICSLRPGIPGVSDNITVKSTVGRFLEHTRIYYFYNKGNHKIFVGSADLMSRNLNRRVEAVFPVEDETLQRELIDHVLDIYRRDTAKSYRLQPDGSYVPVRDERPEEEPLFSAQDWYLTQRKTHQSPVGIGQKKEDG